MIASISNPDNRFYSYVGKRQYELSNHLGNVLSVISDRKYAIDTDSDQFIDYYEPDVLLTYDYSPFGVILKERNHTKQIAKDSTFLEVNYPIQDDFNDGTTQGWTVLSGSTGVSNVNNTLAIEKDG